MRRRSRPGPAASENPRRHPDVGACAITRPRLRSFAHRKPRTALHPLGRCRWAWPMIAGQNALDGRHHQHLQPQHRGFEPRRRRRAPRRAWRFEVRDRDDQPIDADPFVGSIWNVPGSLRWWCRTSRLRSYRSSAARWSPLSAVRAVILDLVSPGGPRPAADRQRSAIDCCWRGLRSTRRWSTTTISGSATGSGIMICCGCYLSLARRAALPRRCLVDRRRDELFGAIR